MSEADEWTAPVNVGLRDAAGIGGVTQGWLDVSDMRPATGDLALSRDLLALGGLTAGDDLLCEFGPDGLRLIADRLRKVYVEITSACNLRCAACIRRAWGEPSGHMPIARFERLIRGLPGAEKTGRREDGIRARNNGAVAPRQPITLSLSGFGEPLVHPDFLAMVELARESGLRVEIISNGTLLDARMAAELVRLGVSQVTISLDGADETTYAGMRGADLSPAAAAAGALAAARRRAQAPLMVGAAFVATRRNVAGLAGLLQLAHDLDLDFVSISNVVPHTAEMAAEMLSARTAWAASYTPASWRPRLHLASMDLDHSTRTALAVILEQAPMVPPPGLDNGLRSNYCRFIHEGMLAVGWDGRVAPCLSLLHSHPEHVNGHWKTVRNYTVGFVDERPLAETWRDPAYRDFRRRVRAFEFSPCLVCGGCPETDTNDTDCYGSPFPSCSECLWAQGIVLCP